jgi:fumarate hydratase class I
MVMIKARNIVELYRMAATELPADVVRALNEALERENGKVARGVLSSILENVEKAKSGGRPICQDTGVPVFYVRHGKTHSQLELKSVIREGTEMATKQVPIRPNAVNTLTGENVGNRPVFHLEEAEGGEQGKLQIDLMLKGGGSENVSAIYQLPEKGLNADRDLAGVSKCVLDAVFKAQGKGCPPYVIGVAMGGNIEEVAYLSKKQLLRKLDDSNKDKELDAFEKEILEKINKLGIGPLGLGGKATALAVKVANSYRHPASFFVGISLGCWCMRRASL